MIGSTTRVHRLYTSGKVHTTDLGCPGMPSTGEVPPPPHPVSGSAQMTRSTSNRGFALHSLSVRDCAGQGRSSCDCTAQVNYRSCRRTDGGTRRRSPVPMAAHRDVVRAVFPKDLGKHQIISYGAYAACSPGVTLPPLTSRPDPVARIAKLCSIFSSFFN
jgi:hypothetical protein